MSFIATMGTMITFRGIVLLFTKGVPVEIKSDAFLVCFREERLARSIPHMLALLQ
jgi:ribose transport system permease protein